MKHISLNPKNGGEIAAILNNISYCLQNIRAVDRKS